MKRIFLILVLLIITVTGCSKPNFQLQFTDYPQIMNENESFTVEAKFLTFNAEAKDMKVILSIRELSSKKELYRKSIELSNKNQPFSFTGINLEKVSDNIYFELKLIKDGVFTVKTSTRSNPTLVANLHTNIITTYFEDTDSDGNALYAAWGNNLKEENDYYCALPYKPGYDGRVYQNFTKEYVKDRWVEVYYPKNEKYVYVQWEDVGPWNVYDPEYVFSTNDVRPYAERKREDTGWSGEVRKTNGAGLDISPEAMNYLGGDGYIKVNWRFVSWEEVQQNSRQDAPWLKDVSGSEINTQIFDMDNKKQRTNTLGEFK
ncbi:hypothetical protein Halha_0762 [Halobacteroides halobius DSM 5150]|uniref:Uncharacterized protein n=1 Tax=Halobacteroides halobius (strain ATCC 35273 / DSM 5150 / MD-1) TaxID=748449 RepID=L0K8P8_HALHC|nr:hypothetical protein [Halobacteroides halobius]AGB40734.1 hypothetical protein Halha_0762 [Halobacteroides halobius DSM 5150]